MELLQKKIDNIKSTNRDMTVIENTIGDSPTNVEVIIDFFNICLRRMSVRKILIYLGW